MEIHLNIADYFIVWYKPKLVIIQEIGLKNLTMANGNIKNLFPPGNDGKQQGVGMIDGDDGNSFVFQTPRDNNNQALVVGPCSYELDPNGKHIESVSQTTSGPIGGIG